MQGADFNAAEAKKAKQDGAVLVKNSGRGERKGDARLHGYLLDYKFTERKSFACNVEAFKKHEKDAWREGYEPIIIAIFDGYKDKSIAMIDWEVLKNLFDEIIDLKDQLRDEEERRANE